MAIEDFTTYTEVDPNSHIGLVGTDHIDHDAYRNEDAYVYKDRGAGHFTDFEHKIDIRSDFYSVFGLGIVWALQNAVDDMKGITDASGTAIFITCSVVAGGIKHIILYETYGGSVYQDNYTSALVNTWYYLTITKSGTSLTCEIYSDSDRTSLVDTLSLTLHADHSFRYIFACNTWNDGNVYPINDDIENLDLQEVVQYTKTFAADAHLLKRGTKTFDADALLLQPNIKGFLADAHLLQRNIKAFDADAILSYIKTKAFTADALLLQPNSKGFLTDAHLLKRYTKTFTVDALLTQRYSKGFLVDGWLLQRRTKTFKVDAILISSVPAPPPTIGTFGQPVPRPDFPIYLMKLIRDYVEAM